MDEKEPPNGIEPIGRPLFVMYLSVFVSNMVL